ncbi:MAG: ParB N-terminal domain-containing protein [bacterium]|nr:ParB N-terminal domain-containing protein [bacterium]
MISTIRLDCIESSTLARPLIAGSIDALAESIGNIGLIQPITVVPCAKYRDGQKVEAFRLVAGHHRVAAMRKIGWVECSARVLPESTTALAAELMEIDENLCRAELSAAQRAKAIKRRKEIWEAMRPNRQRVADLETGTTCPSFGGRGNTEFACDTSRASGESKRDVNRHLARAEALGDDLDEIAGTSLDKGVELDALKDMAQEDRRELIQRAKAGEAVSARSEEDRERNVRLVRQTIADMSRLAKFSSPAEVASIAASIGIGAEEAAIAKAIAGAL